MVYNDSICEINFDEINKESLLLEMKKFKNDTISTNMNIIRKLLNVPKPTCLITGGCGFVGSYFAEKLKDAFDLTIVDNFSSESSRDISCGNVNVIKMDIIDYMKNNMKNNISIPFDLVIHLAAVVGGRQKIEENPIEVAQDLIVDTEFFKWCVKTNPKKVIYFSSSAVYPLEFQGPENYQKLSEDMVDFDNKIGIPDLSYGWSKLTGEFLAQLAHKKHGIDIVCYRPFSGYGHTQHDTYPFQAIMNRAIKKENPLIVWSNSYRDFVHISDIFTFVMDTYEDIHDGSPLNIGTGIATSFTELAQMAAQEIGYNPEIKIIDNMPRGVHYRVSKNSINHLISLRDGIKQYINNK